MKKQKVLFICRENSARSLIAAAFLNAYFGDCYEAEEEIIYAFRNLREKIFEWVEKGMVF